MWPFVADESPIVDNGADVEDHIAAELRQPRGRRVMSSRLLVPLKTYLTEGLTLVKSVVALSPPICVV
ncbi:hypothetical protein TNCV_1540821 [Trichonephila clavipes]|nr:hypothetical protein TNCV_1540821 [Trichonephila clavipes]